MVQKTLLGVTLCALTSLSLASAQSAFSTITAKVEPTNLGFVQTMMQADNDQCTTQVGTLKQLKLSRNPASQIIKKQITFLGQLSRGEELVAAYDAANERQKNVMESNLTLIKSDINVLKNNTKSLFVLPYYPLLEIPTPLSRTSNDGQGLSPKGLYVLQTCKKFYSQSIDGLNGTYLWMTINRIVQGYLDQGADPRSIEVLNDIRASIKALLTTMYNETFAGGSYVVPQPPLECLLDPSMDGCNSLNVSTEAVFNNNPEFLWTVLDYLILKNGSMMSDEELISIVDLIAPKPDPAVTATIDYVKRIGEIEQKAVDALYAMGDALSVATDVYEGDVMKVNRNAYNNAIKQIDLVIKELKKMPALNKDTRFKNVALTYWTGMRKLVAGTGKSLFSAVHNKRLNEKSINTINGLVETYGNKGESLGNAYQNGFADLFQQYGISSQ